MYCDMGRNVSARRGAAARAMLIRLSRQMIRDMDYWKHLKKGDWQAFRNAEKDMMLHSDASDLGFGGTLCFASCPGENGRWYGQGISLATDRLEFIFYASCEKYA